MACDFGEMTLEYFVVKSQTMNSLKTCQRTSIWACNDRKNPPQPRETLATAFENSKKVILLFSVNNCHGWHGYAVMTEPPGNESSSAQNESDESKIHAVDSSSSADTNNMVGNAHVKTEIEQLKAAGHDSKWYPFKIKWLKLYLNEFGEQCLPFSHTAQLHLDQDRTENVNQVRNFQRLPPDIGIEICRRIDNHYGNLLQLKDKKMEEKLSQCPKAFFELTDHQEVNTEEVWKKIVQKVKQLGTVLLACAFGSQRYNLQTESSDTDMFIVYAADTRTVLSFNPPQQTIKSRDDEMCDYTIHEVYRFCELLLSGDPRCVETLFLHPSSVYFMSEQWIELCEHRKQFLTKQCLEKYMRDALGSRGLRQLERMHSGTSPKGNHKLHKLFYIVIRLLQNARNIARCEDLLVYRPDGSQERDVLMAVRRGELSYSNMKALVDEMVTEIEKFELDACNLKGQEILERWLLDLRYVNFKGTAQHS